MRIRSLIGMFAVAVAAGIGAAHAAGVAGQGTWETTLQARDLNADGVVDAFYDTSLNITWMNRVSGVMSWEAATAYHAFYGIGHWRLPVTQRTFDANPSQSSGELTHLWYSTLGNIAPSNAVVPGQRPESGLTNSGEFNFLDLYGRTYWTGTQQSSNSDSGVFLFDMNFGRNTMFGGTPQSAGNQLAMYVHDGDIGVSLVPEPQTYMMLLLGLSLIAARRRSSV